MILLVDNYDSFTYNLAQYLGTFTEVYIFKGKEMLEWLQNFIKADIK